MNPSFTRFWARILVFVGLVLASGGVLLAAVALVIDMPWGGITGHAVFEVTLVAFFLALSGILAGVPFIVLGQVVLVFIEMHGLLGRIVTRLEGREGGPSASPVEELPAP